MRLRSICGDGNPLAVLVLFECVLLEEPAWPEIWALTVIDSDSFRSWLERLGIQGTVSEKSMAGGIGRAYTIGDKYVVKFTIDKKEASAAANLKGSSQQHAANIYGVRLVGSFDRPYGKVDLYAIIMDKLDTGVGKKYRIAGNAVYDYLNHHSGFIEDPEIVTRLVYNKYLKPQHRNELMLDIVRKLVNAIYDLQEQGGVLTQDPHGGNLAFKNRQPAFFDFGRSRIKSIV